MQLYRIFLTCLCLALAGQAGAQKVAATDQIPAALHAVTAEEAPAAIHEAPAVIQQEHATISEASAAISAAPTALHEQPPQLAQPAWQELEFEERAFWATAKASIIMPNHKADSDTWQLNMEGSVENTYERISMQFDPNTAQLKSRVRISKGQREQRLKTWDYEGDYAVRKRRNPTDSNDSNPDDWPVTSARRVHYPDASEQLPVTSAYLLLLLASRLAVEGLGTTRDVLVHTDLNFFRARLTVAPGKAIDTDYSVTGGSRVQGKRDSMAVRVQVRAEGRLQEDPDFSLLGLSGDITLYFDKITGLPLLLHGDAPRLGTTNIHLRGMTPRRVTP